MRGEHTMGRVMSRMSVGSSPHARGAPNPFTSSTPVGGIIPACAGSTEALALLLYVYWDHPRMRGEHEHP